MRLLKFDPDRVRAFRVKSHRAHCKCPYSSPQYLAELTTLVKYNIPVKIIILNNNQLAKISKEQREGQFDVWQTDLSNPKFSEFAKSCGMIGLRVENSSEIGVNMNQLFQAEGPALLEIVTDPDKM